MSRGNNTNNNNITTVISRHHSDDVALGLYTDSTVPVYTPTRVCDNLPSPDSLLKYHFQSIVSRVLRMSPYRGPSQSTRSTPRSGVSPN